MIPESEIPKPTGEAAPLPVASEIDEIAAHAAAQRVALWTGRVRCGLCGHERRVDAGATPAPIDLEPRYPCLAGCVGLVQGVTMPRRSCHQVEG